MKHNLIAYLLILTSIFACSDRENNISKIKDLEIELYSKSESVFNKETANQLINEYTSFADAHKEDSLAPDYLFNAAQVAMGINLSEQAIDIYKRIHNEYSDHEKAATSLFLQGFVYENQLNENAKAQMIYRDFITKYPNHNLIDDAKFSLENIGKSDEEIIREFEQKIAEEKDSI